MVELREKVIVIEVSAVVCVIRKEVPLFGVEDNGGSDPVGVEYGSAGAEEVARDIGSRGGYTVGPPRYCSVVTSITRSVQQGNARRRDVDVRHCQREFKFSHRAVPLSIIGGNESLCNARGEAHAP